MAEEDLQTRFDAAAEKAKATTGVSVDNKGNLYGLFKQATVGPIDSGAARPGLFNQVARQKHDAWAKNADMSQEQAKEKYIVLVDSL